eukprot:m.262198 g.262198  ORF g.262198 m.262198 type:complete len:271 (-) comp44717_c0_seq1:45-857(-)
MNTTHSRGVTKMSNSSSYVPIPKLTPHSQRTPEDKRQAEKSHTATHATLRKLQRAKQGGCADCTSSITGWAALPHGTFVCINCAQVHRSLGRHISIVKAISTGTYTWYPDEVAVMLAMGNVRANKLYTNEDTPPKPEDSASRQEHEKYIKNKYEKRLWTSTTTTPPPPTTTIHFSSSKPRLITKPRSSLSSKVQSNSPTNSSVLSTSPNSRTWGVKEAPKTYKRTPLVTKPPIVQNVMDNQESFETCRSTLVKPIESTHKSIDFFSAFGV